MFKYKGKLLSEKIYAVYWLRVWQKRICRMVFLWLHRKDYNLKFQLDLLPYRYTRHNSKLIRDYIKDDDRYMQWQHNKVVNLKLAINKTSFCLIKPGQTFSFWQIVGRPTARKGFVEGMELSRGQARAGIGGGLCQLSNLLNWMAWHTPLTVVQRSLHSYDPFPDKDRVLPFGSGAAVFWNYVDWQVKNETDNTFQIVVWIKDNRLKGEIRSKKQPDKEFSVFQKNHYFAMQDDIWYRSNEIWRSVSNRGRNGKPQEFLFEELLVKNWSRVCYQPKDTQET